MMPSTIKQLIEAYRSGEISPFSFLQEKLEQARSDDRNAWISCISDAQLQTYVDALREKDSDTLPLYGVPFAIKDNIDLEGLPTTAGCKEYTYEPESSAFVVAQLIAAGAVPLGKTNLDQFATGLVGTRSPWGEGKNSFNPDYISGGSSSGSAVSVATNQVFFSLGTDTAGSGRVPAAFNNLMGLKASKGLLSCTGVVPACKSLDCVTFFARNADDLSLLYSVAAVYDEQDCYARPTQAPIQPVSGSFNGLKVGIPAAEQLAFFGNEEYQTLFAETQTRMKEMGAELVPFDLQPFIDAAKLLYQGPWVAERYAAVQTFFEEQPKSCLPVIETIIGGATSFSAADTFKAMYKLQAYKVQCDKLLSEVDIVMTPTAGTIYTINEVNADPITLNSNLGYYTNFMNLLDYCSVAIPAGFTDAGLPFGVTLFTRAFADPALLSLAKQWQQDNGLVLGVDGRNSASKTMDLLVCGAHMEGLPLNEQLTSLGGVLKEKTSTSAKYKMYKLAGGPPFRPGVVRDEEQGTDIEVEVWAISTGSIGALLAQIPHPLGLGSVELVSGEWVKGFICEPIGIQGAQDISEYGGWRGFLNSES
ncbi:allophanate hydrolase [Vibrio albus]|uniref:Allophanate hydrolase n=1 Tax=Vibrio albus TaxID=2200953 RepID=A0A2U3B5A5_9VIBR|nr:allophanate hydrolase [Vibrio albus]PWI31969.1 allophanate hydrolase [Vibrio albus]